MARSSVGLVIRPRAIEVVELARGLRSSQLSKTTRVPVQGTEEFDFVNAIRTALEQAQVKPRRLAVCLPTQDVLLRFFSLPLLPRAEWEQAVQFEARKFIPFKTDELIWDFQAIEQASNKQLAVVFAGIKKDSFEFLKRCLAGAGVQPTCIEPQNFSLARAVAASYPQARGEFLGVVELDHQAHAAHIAIVKDQVPFLSRDANLAPQSETAPLSNVSETYRAELLLSELRLSFDFFSRQHASATISRVLVYGDEATVRPWCQLLAEQLSCPVEVGALPPLEIRATASGGLPAVSAVGLALRPLIRKSTKLDFLARSKAPATGHPKLHALPTDSRALLRSLAKPVAVQVVLAAVGLWLFSQLEQWHVGQAKAQLEEARQANQIELTLKALDPATLKTLRQQADKQLTMLRGVIHDRISVTEKLDALAKLLPDGMWLEGLRFEHRYNGSSNDPLSLTLRGACFLPGRGGEVEVIGELATQLRQDPKFFQGFAIAHIGEIVTAQERNTHVTYRTFTLNCNSERSL